MRARPGAWGGASRLALALCLVTAAPVPAGAEPPALDVLYVIDDSGGGVEIQYALGLSHAAFFEGLASGGELPSLHAGVTSLNVGVGGVSPPPGCEGDGDGGRLQASPPSGCTPRPEDAFVVDVPSPSGGRERNYDGRLEEVLGCLGELGAEGCGFEQPLEAARRAIVPSNQANAGFLRESAFLLVVIVTNEDDCSALDPTVFDPSEAVVNELGPYGSFRCVRWGIVCGDPPAAPNAPGSYDACEPRESPYLGLPASYAAALKDAKVDRSRVGVVVVAGAPRPVVVANDGQGGLVLEPTCVWGLSPWPAVRLADFTGHFAYGRFVPLCGMDLADEMRSVGAEVGAWIRGWAPTPSDASPATDGAGGGGACACRAARSRRPGDLLLLALLAPLLRRWTARRARPSGSVRAGSLGYGTVSIVTRRTWWATAVPPSP